MFKYYCDYNMYTYIIAIRYLYNYYTLYIYKTIQYMYRFQRKKISFLFILLLFVGKCCLENCWWLKHQMYRKKKKTLSIIYCLCVYVFVMLGWQYNTQQFKKSCLHLKICMWLSVIFILELETIYKNLAKSSKNHRV